MFYTKQIVLDTAGNFSLVNVTDQVRDFVASTGVKHGQVLVFYKHTTGAVIIGEHEAGIIADLQDMFERITPVLHDYKHHLKEVDFNGHAHMRSALMTINVTIPILEGKLLLGTHQEILVIDDQTEPAPRHLVIQVTGE
jgi:secondary thiamine-phosphate synthase enzyme